MVKLTDIIYEANRYQKETGESIPRWRELLKKYEIDKKYYVHFSNVPRVGLYLVNKYETPIGFYSYPLDFHKMSNFAVGRPYAIVFKPKPEARLLNIKKYRANEFFIDLEILKKKYGLTDEQISKWSEESRNQSFAGHIWNITRNISLMTKNGKFFNIGETGGGPTGKWTIILNKDLGYDGVIDYGSGIIHSSEPTQAVFFNTSAIEVIDILNIPEGKVKYKQDFIKDDTNFYGKDLSEKNFREKDLEKAVFEKSNLENTNFRGANLRGANFKDANLLNADLRNADLRSANLTDTNLQGANLQDAILQDANLRKVKNLKYANLKGANLHFANLQNADLEDVNLENADLRNINLTGANLKFANLTGAKLQDAKLDYANLTGTYLQDANLIGTYLEGTIFSNTEYNNKTKFPFRLDPEKVSGFYKI